MKELIIRKGMPLEILGGLIDSYDVGCGTNAVFDTLVMKEMVSYGYMENVYTYNIVIYALVKNVNCLRQFMCFTGRKEGSPSPLAASTAVTSSPEKQGRTRVLLLYAEVRRSDEELVHVADRRAPCYCRSFTGGEGSQLWGRERREPKAVEGLLLSFDYDENISPCIEAFKQMTKLKMLIVKYRVHHLCSSKSHQESIEAFKDIDIVNYLPRSLMVLKFSYYPWSKLYFPMRDLTPSYVDDDLIEVVGFRDAWHGLVCLLQKGTAAWEMSFPRDQYAMKDSPGGKGALPTAEWLCCII
nr:diacylglycerol kinase 5-like isoform X1 [Ipomoea batatas]